MKIVALTLTFAVLSALSIVAAQPASAQQIRVNVGRFQFSVGRPAGGSVPTWNRPQQPQQIQIRPQFFQPQPTRPQPQPAFRPQPFQPQPVRPQSFQPQPSPAVNLQQEVQQAIDYLNAVRQNPRAYAQELGLGASVIPTTAALQVNDRLTAAAQRKADYMVAHSTPTNPFAGMAHVLTIDGQRVGMNQWMREAGYNLPERLRDSETNFECLAGQSLRPGCGVEGMKMLLKDEPHRIPMTGGNDFWAPCSDIGIGLAINPDGRTIQMSVLIAYEQ